MSNRPNIEHVVVLMLENRSFDSMLGRLYPDLSSFDGLTGNETNLFGTKPLTVWNNRAMDPATACIPDPDPGELFADMNVQLFGTGAAGAALPTMGGFSTNYAAQPAGDKPFDPRSVLHYFTPAQVPILNTLAKAFAVCDQWHASAPCQTWPNRFFAHTGTALGHVDNSTFPVPYPAPSIFGRLENQGVSWRVYFHDVPQSLLLGDIWLLAPLRYRFFHQFLVDAATGTLPNYSFIEPRYFADLFLRQIPNDEHPPHNVLFGEQLIAAVYNAVRASPLWEKTLFVITYDEHGGCYDHVPPPNAVPPDNCDQHGFKFDRYGVRVPAVIISPYIRQGTIVQSAPGGLPHSGPPYPFDHTSIIATLRKLFSLGPPLTGRDAVAPDLLGALNLPAPMNDGPSIVAAAQPAVSSPQVALHGLQPLNRMQHGLGQMAASLPATAPNALSQVPPPAPLSGRTYPNVVTAAINAVAQTKSFLGI
jgi:phospholipase C